MSVRQFVIVAGLAVLAACAFPIRAMADASPLSGAEPDTVVLYNLNEFPGGGNVVSSGTPLVDSSGNGYVGRIGVTTRTYANTDLGSGFGIDLRMDCKGYIPANTLPASLFKGDFTMEMWARRGSWLNSSGVLVNTSRLFTCRDGNIGWIFEMFNNSGVNKLRIHNGTTWVENVLSGFVLPTTTWTHWAMTFTNLNPGAEDSQYSVSLYVTASTATTPTLMGTFTFNPARTATQLAATAFAFNGDAGGTGFGTALGSDMVDGLRLSNIARTSFETLLPPSNNLPPTTITTLTGSNPQLTSIDLAWSAPWDDHGAGNRAAIYELRYGTAQITTFNWDSATPAAGLPAPAAPGTVQTFTVTDLAPATTYYFALKSVDESGLASVMSNRAIVTTLTPDTTPPAAVTLTSSDVGTGQLTLHWTATGDDGMAGSASRYDIRHSTNPITDDISFAAATAAPQVPPLTPKVPGQAESFVVSGLTPGTTYYLAVKVADEMSNWSSLSNVLEVTTLVDVDPPAPIGDLAASGTDALTIDLTWTASGDDGDAGTAAIYEIRYSTGPIDEGNWASATLAANWLAPKAAGSIEHFTILAVQPETAYYVAIKVSDESGNVSALSNVAAHTTAPLGDMPVITTVGIAEKAGVTTANYPLTLSMIFKQGDVAENVVVRAGGLVLPTQTDVKVRWPDGSVRHALVSLILPQLGSGQTVTLEFLAGGPNYNATWLTKEQLLAGDFEALLAVTVGINTTNVSARQMLQGLGTVDTWVKGAIATEYIIRDWNSRVAGALNVSYRVRVYPSIGAIRVSTVVDDTWIDARTNLTYDFSLSLGRSSPQVVFAKSNFTQWASSRWHKVFWQGTTPPTIETRYNLPYMIKAGAFPNYDASLVVPESAITGVVNTWNSYGHDIMDNGALYEYFPTTGGRDEIGPYPRWASLYICSMDYRLGEVVRNYGDLSGSITIHYRESDPARSFYRRPVKVDDRPTIWMDNLNDGSISGADRFPNPTGDTSSPWTVDLAHQPSLAYVPYVTTGDLYYLEEMHFWACFDLGASSSAYRGGTQCWLVDQVRGNAWALRNIVDAAAMTPADMPERAYLEEKILNNINRWNTNLIINGQLAGAFPTVRYIYTSGIDDTLDPAVCSAGMSSWQTDYMTWSFVHAYQMGYPALDIVHWAGQGLIDRFSDWPGWNRYRGTTYVFPAKGRDGAGNPAPFATWADVNSAFVTQPGPTGFGGGADSYEATSRGVMALVADLPNGSATWNWFDNAFPSKGALSYDTRWAFVPPQHTLGDINADASVDVIDLLYFVDTFGLMIGESGYDPRADFNGDFSVDVIDLLTFVENFGM